MDVKADVLEILGDYVDVPVNEIDTTLDLKFAAGLDSFVLLSFIGALEDHFGITLPNDSISRMHRLDDLISFVESNCN